MLEKLTADIENMIMETANRIDSIAEGALSEIGTELVQDTFQSSGTITGRNWQPNTVATVRRKGFDKRNIEEGDLEHTLMQPGFILDDDYMNQLPVKYTYANKINDYTNRFDNIGRTPEDQQYIKKKLIEVIRNAYN